MSAAMLERLDKESRAAVGGVVDRLAKVEDERDDLRDEVAELRKEVAALKEALAKAGVTP